jgi:PAS domain S-box-containing protein
MRESAIVARAAELALPLVESLRRERALQASRRRWRSVIDASPMGIALVGEHGRIVGANRAYCHLVGYSEAELRRMSPVDLIHPDDRDQAAKELNAVREERARETGGERRYRRRDGRTVWARVTMLCPDAEDAGVACVEVAEDLSERRWFEAELRRGNHHLEESERVGATGSWVMDLRTGLLLWSHEMFRIFGLPPSARTPTVESAWSHVHPDDAGPVRASVELGIREGREIQGEHRLIRPDGSVAQVRYWGRPVARRAGEVLEYIGTVRDVTEERRVRHQLRTTLEQVRALAVRQLQARDDERRRIARELHATTVQKLAALRLNLAALKRAGAAPAGDGGALEECVALADSSITDLRTLAYLLHPPMLDEAGLASALRWYAAGFAKRSGLTVRIDVPPEMERFPQEVEITLFRLVQECLINILRHASTDRAAVRLGTEAGRLIAEVQDWGTGMAADDETIFGVGLSGMRERIEQLGGVLRIRSGRHGTTVTAVLPVEGP